MFNVLRTFFARCAQAENPEKLRKSSLEFDCFGRGFTMVRMFLFEGCEAAWYIGGAQRAVRRRCPEHGHATFRVDPLTVEGRPMRRRLGCRVGVSVGLDGRLLDVAVYGDSACARDLYRALRNDGLPCFRVW